MKNRSDPVAVGSSALFGSFRSGIGLMGATEPGQRVTAANVGELPPGSVVRLEDGSRLIHLHDDIWLWCNDHAWTYDRVEWLKHRLGDHATLRHLPLPNVKSEPRAEPAHRKDSTQ